MESKIKQLPFVKIQRDKYWNIVYSCLTKRTKEKYETFDDWFESDNSYTYSHLVDYKMGLHICNNDEELPEDDDIDDDFCFYFYIIDQKKCLWAKLKYGI